MYADDQVILLLKFALTIGPVAVYFLALGFLNAQPRPAVLTGRADFMLLSIVLFPLLLWAVFLVAGLSPVAVAAAALAAGGLFWAMLPPRHSSWVVYNVTAKQFLRALGRALEHIGQSPDRTEIARGGDPVWIVSDMNLRIRISPFSMLQNVTCRFEPIEGQAIRPEQLGSLRQSLQDCLGGTHTLPSASAAAFLIIGTVMLSAPLLMMARNVDAIVKVVRSLFA